MYLPDVNVWVALAFSAHAHHHSARSWFEGALGDRICYFCRLTQVGFLRIATNPAASESAVSLEQAWKLYDHFLAHERVAFAEEPAGLELAWRGLTGGQRFSPKIWNDAYLAAFALAAGVEVVTYDKGFAQYPNVKRTILA